MGDVAFPLLSAPDTTAVIAGDIHDPQFFLSLFLSLSLYVSLSEPLESEIQRARKR